LGILLLTDVDNFSTESSFVLGLISTSNIFTIDSSEALSSCKIASVLCKISAARLRYKNKTIRKNYLMKYFSRFFKRFLKIND